MELIREYWWLIIVVVGLVLAFILLRPKQRVTLTDSAPVRPHMAQQKSPAEGRGLVGEVAAATSDITGDILRAPVHSALEGESGSQHDFGRIKGVGPRFADALRGLGSLDTNSFAQLATEIERIDAQIGAFSGQSPGIAWWSRRTIWPGATPTGSNKSLESSSLRLPPRSQRASCVGGTRSACRSCVRPCRRFRTTSHRGGIFRPCRGGA